MKWLSHQNCNCVLNLHKMSQEGARSVSSQEKILLWLSFSSISHLILSSLQGNIWTVIRSIMTNIMWWPSHARFNPIRNPFRAPARAIYGNHFSSVNLCSNPSTPFNVPCCSGSFSIFSVSLPSTVHTNTSSISSITSDKLSPSHFSLLILCPFSFLSFPLLIIEKEVLISVE